MPKHKVEPIDLLYDLLSTNISGVTAGPCVAKRLTSGEVGLSRQMAIELAREAMAYKQFFIRANALATLTDYKAKGGYISSEAMESARDLYVEAKNICIALQTLIDLRDVKKER